MNAYRLKLELLGAELTVCRLAADDPIPPWAMQSPPAGAVLSVTRTSNELSIVAASECVPVDVAKTGIRRQHGWRGLRVQGTLDFSLVGVLAELCTTLAEAGISLFAFSTFDTDYVLVQCVDLEQAVEALTARGHQVQPAAD